MAGGVAKTKRNVLLLAALLGLITSGLIYLYMQPVNAAKERALAPVVVATQEILPRTIVEPGMVMTRRIPIREAPKNAYFDLEEVVGKVALTKIPADSPITVADVGAKGASLGLAFVIPPSMRAVTVAVDPVIGVAGFLKPGDHVDVVATFGRGNREAVAKTVLQDVQLLALGSQIEKENVREGSGKASAGKDTATLLVTPAEAERLVLAENEGKLRLVLRAVGDILRVDSKGATSRAVTGGTDSTMADTSVRETRPRTTYAQPAERTPPPPRYYVDRPIAAPKPKPATTAAQPENKGQEIEVIRGTKVETVVVEEKE